MNTDRVEKMMGYAAEQGRTKQPERNPDSLINRLQQTMGLLAHCENLATQISDAIEPVPQNITKSQDMNQPNSVVHLVLEIGNITSRLELVLGAVMAKL